MRRAAQLLTLLAFATAGCPYVPDGEVRVEAGSLPIAPGATVSFGLYCDPLFDGWELVSGPGHCGGDWKVQDHTGGNDTFGTITPCGEYTAPTTKPPQAPEIIGRQCSWGSECTDTCGALLILTLDD